jgi:hypothetical protein
VNYAHDEWLHRRKATQHSSKLQTIEKFVDNLAFLAEKRGRRKIARTERDLLVHGFEKFFIGLGPVHLVEQKFHRVDDAELRQNFAQDPNPIEIFFSD